jgi:hypothetical protein
MDGDSEHAPQVSGSVEAATGNAFTQRQESVDAELADFNDVGTDADPDGPPPTKAQRSVASPPRGKPATKYVAQNPRDVVKAAKARIKELDALLREADRARKERDELKRLVAAATGKTQTRTADGQPLIGRTKQNQ